MRDFIREFGWWFLGVRDGVCDGWRSLSRLFKLSLLGFALAAACYGAYVALVHIYGVRTHPLHAHPTLDPIGTWAHEFAQAPLQTLVGLALATLIAGVALLYVAACTQSIARSLVATSRRRRTRRGEQVEAHTPTGTSRSTAGAAEPPEPDASDEARAIDRALWDDVVATARKAGSEHL